MMYLPDKACKMFVACSILHNICRREGIPLPVDEALAPRRPDDQIRPVLNDQPDAAEEQETERRRGWELRGQLMALLVGN